MLLGKNRKLRYGIPITVLVLSTVYLLLPSGLKLSYVLDDAHLTDVIPQVTQSNITCPQCGSQLDSIALISAEKGVIDAAWRVAYFCGQEDVFWVADCPGLYFAGWYGPFYGRLFELRNIIALSLLILSGAALILLVIGDKILMKKATARACSSLL